MTLYNNYALVYLIIQIVAAPHVGHSNCDLPCDGVRIEPIPKGKGWRWDLSQPGVKV